ncbi:hypothetical protein IMSAGC019_02329 [Lachnospiraceae bacterium]|nr:hypothetical protein IMSAGC019_02329 [Lachnospiraceae bacterium]
MTDGGQGNIPSTWRGGIYLRLSREDPGARGRYSDSIENQKEYIEEFLRKKPEIVPAETYIDDGCSGVDFERPSFQRMLQDIREDKINCVIVKDLSRFGRNYIEVGKYIERLFPLLGVRFIAINDNYDSREDRWAAGHMAIPFKNLINDAYCRDISLKIRSHLEVKRQRGEFTGAFPVYGYIRGREKNRLVADPYASEIVKEIFRMKIQGMGQQAIADKLNRLGISSPAEYKKEQGSGYQAVFQTHTKARWTAMAIRRILTNEAYLGTLVQGKESTPNYKIKVKKRKPPEEWARVENAHQGIITRADFGVVSEILERDTRTAPGEGGVSLYSGYLACGDCGYSMARKKIYSNRREYVYYICTGNKKQKGMCSSHRIREGALNINVLEAVGICLEYFAGWPGPGTQPCGREASPCQGQGELLEREAGKRREELGRNRLLKQACWEDYQKGVLTQEEFFLFREELENRIQDTEKAIRELERKKQALAGTGEEKQRAARSANCPYVKENQGKLELGRSLVVRFINRIYLYEGRRMEIIFRFRDGMEEVPG